MSRIQYAILQQPNMINVIPSARSRENSNTQSVNLNNTLHSLVGYSDIHKYIIMSSIVHSYNRVKIWVVCGSGVCIVAEEGCDG